MAPAIAAALPAIIGSIVRAVGIGGGVAGAVTVQNELAAAVSGLVAAGCALWGVIQKIRAGKK